jgi:hypothetical protein
MSERKSQELRTPGGHAIVMKEYITAREFMPIIKDTSANPTPADNVEKALKMIEVAVISIDGVTDNLKEVVQDLPLEDYIFVTTEVSRLANFQKTKS